ncbi:MAG: T9SS type A sorting domain-containing protein [Candidatus Zixiibacteriota bacterium]
MKKNFLMTLLVAVLVALSAGVSVVRAQCSEDPLARDSVRIVQQIVPLIEGDTIFVPLQLWNDENIQGISLGFHWDSEAIRFAGAKISASLLGSGFLQLVQPADTANNNLLVGTINFSGGVYQTNGTWATLYTLKFVVQAEAQTSRIDIDSAFYPPAGFFVLGKTAGGDVCPEYVHNPGRDILLPVSEYDTPILPQDYALSQNQPNPFNPTTTIDFALPRAAKTKIEIYNILGQKVITLVDEYLAAGNKRVEWNGKDDGGNDVASGVYLYRMTANDYTETKKMMLMK